MVRKVTTRVRSTTVDLPPWFMTKLNLAVGRSGWTRQEVTDRLNAKARREIPWHVQTVNAFLKGSAGQSWDMMEAFLQLFPELERPIFTAESEEMSQRMSGKLPPTVDAETVLPDWWLTAVRERCDGLRLRADQIAPLLNSVARPDPPFTADEVDLFLRGERTTLRMMGAFLVLFSDLPAPLFEAESLEEARELQEAAKARRQRQPSSAPGGEAPTVAQTIEDTGTSGISAAPAKKRTGRRER
jgi:hypothetical protein